MYYSLNTHWRKDWSVDNGPPENGWSQLINQGSKLGKAFIVAMLFQWNILTFYKRQKIKSGQWNL